MQAIVTKYYGPTNTRGSRIKAWCERGSISIPYPHELGHDDAHASAAWALIDRFNKEDSAKYGPGGLGWGKEGMIRGGLPKGVKADYCFVFPYACETLKREES